MLSYIWCVYAKVQCCTAETPLHIGMSYTQRRDVSFREDMGWAHVKKGNVKRGCENNAKFVLVFQPFSKGVIECICIPLFLPDS